MLFPVFSVLLLLCVIVVITLIILFFVRTYDTIRSVQEASVNEFNYQKRVQSRMESKFDALTDDNRNRIISVREDMLTQIRDINEELDKVDLEIAQTNLLVKKQNDELNNKINNVDKNAKRMNDDMENKYQDVMVEVEDIEGNVELLQLASLEAEAKRKMLMEALRELQKNLESEMEKEFDRVDVEKAQIMDIVREESDTSKRRFKNVDDRTSAMKDAWEKKHRDIQVDIEDIQQGIKELHTVTSETELDLQMVSSEAELNLQTVSSEAEMKRKELMDTLKELKTEMGGELSILQEELGTTQANLQSQKELLGQYQTEFQSFQDRSFALESELLDGEESDPIINLSTADETLVQDGYAIHIFRSVRDDHSIQFENPIKVDVLVVAGGGGGGVGGGAEGGGGGGAGGVSYEKGIQVDKGRVLIAVGKGGAGKQYIVSGVGNSSRLNGNSGKGSSFGSYVETMGGGFGGGHRNSGGDGGSGGGTRGGWGTQAGGRGIQGQGFDGGSGGWRSGGSGGGGAAGTGAQTLNANGGNGGNGRSIDISGKNVVYGGGGGGGGKAPINMSGEGGRGGGGDGAGRGTRDGRDGKENTGGGGGGTSDNGGRSGAGGSGIVIVRYRID